MLKRRASTAYRATIGAMILLLAVFCPAQSAHASEGQWYTYGLNTFYRMPDGSLMTGWMPDGENRYYFNSDGILMKGWFYIADRKYYADMDGCVKSGWFEADDKTWYAGINGVVTGWQHIDGKDHYFMEDGALAKGAVLIRDRQYLFDEEGCPMSGWRGKAYVLQDGSYASAWTEIDGKTYFFDEKTKEAVTGTVMVADTSYAFDSEGALIEMPVGSAADASLTVSYDGVLYEGDLFDPSKIRVTRKRADGSSEEVYGYVLEGYTGLPFAAKQDITLGIVTENGRADLHVPCVNITSLVGRYNKTIKKGDSFDPSAVEVDLQYEDGAVRPLEIASVDAPPVMDDVSVLTFHTDYGNAELKLHAISAEEITATYSEPLYEGSVCDPAKISVRAVFEGQETEVRDFEINGSAKIDRDGIVEIRTSYGNTFLSGEIIPIESVELEEDTIGTEGLLNVPYVTLVYTDGTRIRSSDETLLLQVNGRPTSADLSVRIGGTSYPLRKPLTASGNAVSSMQIEGGTYNAVSLGIWRLTAYADTPHDQGKYVGQTASGAPLVDGRTVAVSSATMARRGLHFGDRLLINSHIYVIEDHGGSAMYNEDWVDIFVADPAREYDSWCNGYAEVYLLS